MTLLRSNNEENTCSDGSYCVHSFIRLCPGEVLVNMKITCALLHLCVFKILSKLQPNNYNGGPNEGNILRLESWELQGSELDLMEGKGDIHWDIGKENSFRKCTSANFQRRIVSACRIQGCTFAVEKRLKTTSLFSVRRWWKSCDYSRNFPDEMKK